MPRRGNVPYYYTYVVCMERGFTEDGIICSLKMSICRNNKFKEVVVRRKPIEPAWTLFYMITVRCCWHRFEIVPDSVVIEDDQSVSADMSDLTQRIVSLITSKHNGVRVMKDWMINVFCHMFPSIIYENEDE